MVCGLGPVDSVDMQSVDTQMPSVDMPSVDMLLTAETAPAYANGVGALDGASHAVEVDGGNLNYAFRVSCADGNSIFLKQTPGFVKARSFIPLSA